MPAEENIEQVEMEAPPFIYYVPSSFDYSHTVDSTDMFTHRDGGELCIERFVFTRDGEASHPSDALSVMRCRLEDADVGESRSTPVLLSTGFAFISYDSPHEDDSDSTRLYCELCGFLSDGQLAVIRFSSPVHHSDLQRPDVLFYSHLIRQYARMTRLTAP